MWSLCIRAEILKVKAIRAVTRVEDHLGHVQVSRLIPASQSALFRYVTELRNARESLGPASFSSLQLDFPSALPLMKENAEFEVEVMRFGVKRKMYARVGEYEVPSRFEYHQIKGPFRSWSHLQALVVHDAKTTVLTDLVHFQLSYGVLGALADDLFLRNEIRKQLEMRLIRIEDYFKHTHADVTA